MIFKRKQGTVKLGLQNIFTVSFLVPKRIITELHAYITITQRQHLPPA